MIISTINIIMSFKLLRSFPAQLSSPPHFATAKPDIMANTIMGSILLRLIKPLKSLTVREPTIISLMLEASAISDAPMAMDVFEAGGQILTTTRTRAAAKPPVTTKVHTRLPKIFPRRFMLTIFPTAVVIDT